MSVTDYLESTAKAAEKLYTTVLTNHCIHSDKVFCFDDVIKNKSINCAASMSITLQLAGCLPIGSIVSHTEACGLNGKKLIDRKSMIDDAMFGYEKLEHCKIVRTDKMYKELPEELKRAGVCYVYDSNCAVSAGNGYIYSCNKGLGQMNLKKEYVRDKMRFGYSFRSIILYCIVPNSLK